MKKLFPTILSKVIPFISGAIILAIILEVARPGTILPQRAANEAPENRVESYGLTASPEYAQEISFISSFYTQKPTYSADFNPKDRCRIEYLFVGGVDLCRPQDVQVNIETPNGIPGGVTATGEGTHAGFFIHRFKVISNRELSINVMQEMASPPKGWLNCIWSNDERFVPGARKSYENCVPKKPFPQR